VMVGYYGFKILRHTVAGGQAIFERNFQLFSGIKVKFVDKMMRRSYLCVIL